MDKQFDDPKLTAYVFGELPADETDAISAAAEIDPGLRRELEEISAQQTSLMEIFGQGDESLQPQHYDAIRRAAKEASRKGAIVKLSSHRKSARKWAVPLAAAAVIALGIFILTLIPSAKTGAGGGQVANGDGDGDGDNTAVSNPKAVLEMNEGSFAAVVRSIRIDEQLPEKSQVNLGELITEFPLKAKDKVALWKGSTVGAEIIPCPWKPSGSLVFLEIKRAKGESGVFNVRYLPKEGSVYGMRVIGVAESLEAGLLADAETLEPGSSMFLVIEVDSSSPALGEVYLFVDGEDGPAIELVRDPAKEPSEDAAFAALICAFGHWLAAEESGYIDDALVLGLAREVASGTLVADRYDFLDLIDQAMKLADER
ncbi:MAG: hypothetical protein NWT08_07380 [Akkermansiaceae bacterium]|jgi:hypothetical protein|nr:hypothetical protein [Akkermansiaceae bacterium]MDP4645850.1 hypothetical protein [Akkermansiaceae bacterium]MDP4779170.1 hypothetical protein [Akkermansiaceae bacterium]MDP4848217.1 hypothetical protein [Akkermansiaceae bacterium]MDP4898576.1 hypothetical protein [Akkermansiaceae bacterium]